VSRTPIENGTEYIAQRPEDGKASARRTENRVLHGAHRLVHATGDIIHDLFGALDLCGRNRRRPRRIV
jgi:hypothetical protein